MSSFSVHPASVSSSSSAAVAGLLLANWPRLLLTLLAASLLLLVAKSIQLVRWRRGFQRALRDFPKHPNGSWFLGDVPEVSRDPEFYPLISRWRRHLLREISTSTYGA